MRAASLILLVAAAACGGSQPPPAGVATEVAARRLSRAEIRANDVAWSVPAFRAELRRSPAPCSCPQWEARLAGEWTRVEVRFPDPDSPSARLVLDQTGDEGIVVPLTLTSEVVEGNNGWRYHVVEIATEAQVLDGLSIE